MNRYEQHEDNCWCYIENGELIAESCCPIHGDESRDDPLEAWTDTNNKEIVGRP